jgi:hypothetical protein
MSSSLLLPKKKYHRIFGKSMAFPEETRCQKRKSCEENSSLLVHNAKTAAKFRV